MPFLVTDGTTVSHPTDEVEFAGMLLQFVTGVAILDVSGMQSGIEPRRIKVDTAAPTENWSLVCTDAATGVYSVTGSVSGAQAAITVGAPYDNGIIALDLVDTDSLLGGATLGETLIIPVVTGPMVTAASNWTLLRQYEANDGGLHFFVMGPGTSGADEIFVSFATARFVEADAYNVRFFGGIGFNESCTTASTILGASPLVSMLLSDATMPCWFIGSGRRFIAIAKVSTVYESCYMGFMLPTGTSSEYPYPLIVGGTAGAGLPAVSWRDTSADHRAFFDPSQTLIMRDKGGAWVVFDNDGAISNTFPAKSLNILPCFGGNRALFPVTLHSSTPLNGTFGDLDGVFYVSGFNLFSEDVIDCNGVDRLCIQSAFRTGIKNFAAFSLE